MSQSVLLVYTAGTQDIGDTVCNVARFTGLRCVLATCEDEFSAALRQHEVDYIGLVLNQPNAALDRLVRLIQQARCYAPLLAITESTAAAELAASYIPEHGCALQGTLTIPFTAQSFRKSLELPAPPEVATLPIPDISEQTEAFHEALRSQQIATVLQPRFATHNLRLEGVEVLARWHCQQQEVPPAAFVRLAEETDQAQNLTLAVLKQGLASLNTLMELVGRPLNLTLNLCSSLLYDTHFHDQMVAACQEQNVATHQVTLDLTETETIAHIGEVKNQLERLHELGFGLSIHDFGTGYSTLQQLSRLPLAELKADRHYVLSALAHQHSRLMTRATIELAHNLDLTACATGVENQETLDLLRQFGCHLVQGFYLAAPMSMAQLRAWLQQDYPALRDC